MRQSFEEFLRLKYYKSPFQDVTSFGSWMAMHTPHTWQSLAEEWSAQQPEDEVVDSLRLILPLAKGYVANNRVGSNDKYIEQAESILAKRKERICRFCNKNIKDCQCADGSDVQTEGAS